MNNQQELIFILSVILGITLVLFWIMVWYFKTELQYKVNCLNNSFKREQETIDECYKKIKESTDNEIRLIKDIQEQFNIKKELVQKNSIFFKHNRKYATICRKLYNENKVLQEKIAELEKNKLKKREKRL